MLKIINQPDLINIIIDSYPKCDVNFLGKLMRLNKTTYKIVGESKCWRKFLSTKVPEFLYDNISQYFDGNPLIPGFYCNKTFSTEYNLAKLKNHKFEILPYTLLLIANINNYIGKYYYLIYFTYSFNNNNIFNEEIRQNILNIFIRCEEFKSMIREIPENILEKFSFHRFNLLNFSLISGTKKVDFYIFKRPNYIQYLDDYFILIDHIHEYKWNPGNYYDIKQFLEDEIHLDDFVKFVNMNIKIFETFV
jgi:hypothetical protein